MSTILVVDDDLTQQLIVFKILKNIGLNFIFAEDGQEALELAQRYCPDLIILDIILPRMNGYEVCRRLKSDKKTQKLAVLMCSNKTENCDRYWGIKQGADAYISKPCHPQELINTVKYLLEEGRTYAGVASVSVVTQKTEYAGYLDGSTRAVFQAPTSGSSH